ncbi:MAG TPA: winged helix-turn-helix transcriptional regulator [Solirubrobacteraceae bacterium]|nr:winged helix-turn-helix transcriptional regulator [Solirubrobacteraceae bacterium]
MRLNHLVEQGVLERRPYDRRPRYEHPLTEKGTELIDLVMVMVMVAWGTSGWPERPAHLSSTATTHVERSAASSCAATTAASRCAPAMSTCFRAPAPRRDRAGPLFALLAGGLNGP